MLQFSNYAFAPYRCTDLEVECDECGGEGQAMYEVTRYGGGPGAYSPFEDVMMECQKCRGVGYVEVEEEYEDD